MANAFDVRAWCRTQGKSFSNAVTAAMGVVVFGNGHKAHMGGSVEQLKPLE